MNFIDFRKSLIDFGCIGTHQISVVHPDFNYNNLTRWIKQGLLVKLRNGYYAFPEFLGQSDFVLYVSNRIYMPSYLSLHTVLAFYGIIPEAVIQITAVSPLKTAEFENKFGHFSYQKIKEVLMFGYEPKPYGNHSILMAYPEKALLDLLYLYPFYETKDDMAELRLDDYFMTNELNNDRLDQYCILFNNAALNKRVKLLKQTYGI